MGESQHTELQHFINWVKGNQNNAACMQNINLELISQFDMSSINKISKQLGYDRTIAELRQEKQHIWHIAMPKSGSTWVSNVLCKQLTEQGWKKTPLVPAYGRREQEIVPAEIYRQKAIDAKIFSPHQHQQCSEYVIDTIKALNIKVIVQVRNLADIIVSCLDHFNIESRESSTIFMADEQWQHLADEEKLNALSRYTAPWLVRFWVSWYIALKEHDIPHLIINYDDLLEDKSLQFKKIFEFCQQPMTSEEISNSLIAAEKGFSRKNKAITGRGKMLPDDIKSQLSRLMSYYPEVDFSGFDAF